MKLRIAIWAAVGALVVVFWGFYFAATHSTPGWTLVSLTMPIALARHYVLSIYAVLLLNAATYALVGTVVETIWLHYKNRRHLIPN